jgi:hypothetical protein
MSDARFRAALATATSCGLVGKNLRSKVARVAQGSGRVDLDAVNEDAESGQVLSADSANQKLSLAGIE